MAGSFSFFCYIRVVQERVQDGIFFENRLPSLLFSQVLFYMNYFIFYSNKDISTPHHLLCEPRCEPYVFVGL
jgi:hypothetical protein